MRLLALSSVLLLAVTSLAAQGLPTGASAAPRATAYIFTTTDCPIANRYAPDIRRLADEYSARGIDFRLVFVNGQESDERIRAHTTRFELPLLTQRDPGHVLVKRFGITVTPEVALVDSEDRLVYRGRIDDRYLEVGRERAQPTRHEFADALSAVAGGRAVAVASAPAVGCYVSDFTPVTYVRDVAPILASKCVSCHRPDGPGPFSLRTYDETRQRASLIAAVTRKRFMPPYNAVSEAGTFVGQARLSDEEIETLSRWADEDTPLGDATLATRISTPSAATSGRWQLGTPDLVVTIPQPFVLPAEPGDAFRIFVVRLPVAATRYVRGVEFLPGNSRVVHHANLRLDSTPRSRVLDEADPLPGYDGLLARTAVYPDGHFLGWTPGQVAPLVGPDLAWQLNPNTDLVLQLHLQPSGARELVQPRVGLYFSDVPPTRAPTILRLGSQGIDIPAGDANYVVRDSYTLPVDVELHALQPHAHYRLRSAQGTATLPDGTRRELITIADWDFRWQHVYRFAQPVLLPKGTQVAMEYRYDNSPASPQNPQLPPQRVFWGQRSVDEMGDLWFQFVAPPADRPTLGEETARKMTREDITGYETMLRANPQDRELHDDVALLYLASNDAPSAVKHFRASLAIAPSATAHFNLGTAFTVAGDLTAAAAAFRDALHLQPTYAAAHNNLGSVLATQGDVPAAIALFQRAVALDPSNVRALRNLAWHSATLPDLAADVRRDAVAAGERAATLTDTRDADVLAALAAAYRAAGRSSDASRTEALAAKLRGGE